MLVYDDSGCMRMVLIMKGDELSNIIEDHSFLHIKNASTALAKDSSEMILIANQVLCKYCKVEILNEVLIDHLKNYSEDEKSQILMRNNSSYQYKIKVL